MARLATGTALSVAVTACTSPPTTGGGAATLECPVGALDQADGPVRVALWHVEAAKSQETLDALAARYNASQDRVEVVTQHQGNWDELFSKYQGAIASDQLPGLVEIEDTKLQTMVDGGTLLPAQACMDATGFDLDDLLPAVRSYYTVDDVYWPGFLAATEPIMVFNREHFERAGLDPDDPPGTLDELETAARALKDAGVSTTPFAFNMSRWYVESWLNGAGAPVVDGANGREAQPTASTFDNPTTHELYEWLDRMRRDGLLLPASPESVDDLVAVATQESSMAITSSGAATAIVEFLATTDTPDLATAAPFPGMTEPGRVRVSSGGFYVVNQVAPEVQSAAWDFISWMLQEEQAVEWLTSGSYMPVQASVVDDPDVIAYYRDDPAGRMIGVAAAQLGQIDPAAPGPLIGPYVPFTQVVDDSLQSLLLGGDPVDVVIEQADAQIQAALDEYYGTTPGDQP